MPVASNIGAIGRRRRYIVLGRAPLGSRFLVFVPFALGALGILQARGQT
jgi:hypothetical protein